MDADSLLAAVSQRLLALLQSADADVEATLALIDRCGQAECG